MKIRNGFVSNSSSSSFCIYGICIEKYGIEEALIKKGVTEEELEEGILEYLDNWCLQSDLRKQGLDELEIKKKCMETKILGGMEANCIMDDDEIFIGESWSSIGDNETGSQFKARIEQTLKEVLGDDIKCATYEEAWRNG
jgi:hypothetical protein